VSNRPVTMYEAQAEMRRLMQILMKSNRDYLARERQLEQLHASGRQNYSGDLTTVMMNDLPLKMHSGTTKAMATIIAGLGAYIEAELAIKRFRKEYVQEALFDDDQRANRKLA